jgi:hypothetical protein
MRLNQFRTLLRRDAFRPRRCKAAPAILALALVGSALLATPAAIGATPLTGGATEPRTVAAPTAVSSSQEYVFRNGNSGKCLDVADASRADGANVQQYTCHGGANQRWRVVAVPNDFRVRLVNVNSGKCLDVANAGLADGANIQQFTCHGRANQLWQLRFAATNRWFLVAGHSLKCADVANASRADGANVQQYTCHGGLNQVWIRS